MELASVLQSMRCDQSTPVIEESNSVMPALVWTASAAINNQLYTDPSPNVLIQCIQLFNAEPLKGFSFLIALGCVSPSARDVAKFLLYTSKLNKSSIGLVLGENSWFHKDIASELMKLIGFSGLHIVSALRKVYSHIDIPLEGTRLNNLLQAFASAYAKENVHFGGPDAIQGLCFSIIMLDSEKLSRKEFYNSAKGLLEGKDYPVGVLGWIYDEVVKDPLCRQEEEEEGQSFDGFAMEGVVMVHKKMLHVGLCDDILVFLSQASRSPYAIAILKDCEISDSWLQGSVAVKNSKGIVTAKFTKEGRVKVKREAMLVFKSEEWRKWMEAISIAVNKCNFNY
jgi:hypothetical protein